MAKTTQDNSKRFRISVPTDDISVIEWLRRQENISFSLRVLIKDSIAQHGYMDVTCLADPSMGKPRGPGRPPGNSASNVASYQGYSEPEPLSQSALPQQYPQAPLQQPAQLLPQQTQAPAQRPPNNAASDDGFFDPEALLGGGNGKRQ